MRYELGVMDLYPIAVNRTCIENNPLLSATLKETIDEERLKKAVKDAIENHPLFGCRIKRGRQYYLETHEGEFSLIQTKTKKHPLEFGKNTGGFPWQICYDEKTISLEWCHCITDGRGALSFFSDILNFYYGVDVDKREEMPLNLGLESFYDKNEEGIIQKKQAPGFKAKDLPYIKRGYKTDCHVVKVSTGELLRVAKKNDASPASVIPPLFSKALRKHLKATAKNRNVSCNVVIDCRVPMKKESMHNCIISKCITYVDRFDDMPFATVSTIYRTFLDLATQRENIIKEATRSVDEIRPLVKMPTEFLQHCVALLVAKVIKHTNSNFTFTYLGKINLNESVEAHVEDMQFRSWTDIGECNIAALDFKGNLIMNICENYEDKGVISTFRELCRKEELFIEEIDCFEYEQANYRNRGF